MKNSALVFLKFSAFIMITIMSIACLNPVSMENFSTNETVQKIINGAGDGLGNDQEMTDNRQPQLSLQDGTPLGYGETVELPINESTAILIENASAFVKFSWEYNDAVLGTTAILTISASGSLFNTAGSYIVSVYTIDAQGVIRSTFFVVKVESI